MDSGSFWFAMIALYVSGFLMTVVIFRWQGLKELGDDEWPICFFWPVAWLILIIGGASYFLVEAAKFIFFRSDSSDG